MYEDIELKQVYLGLKPYVLIEVTVIEDEVGAGGLDIDLAAGGGVEVDMIPDILKLTAENIESKSYTVK